MHFYMYTRPNINFIEAQDHNLILHSKVFVHSNRQLRALHLVLGCTPSYTRFQDPGVAFQVKNPLLMCIDMRLKGSLPNIYKSEARERGPYKRRSDPPKPLSDSSGDLVFQTKFQHTLMNESNVTEADENMVQWKDIQLTNYLLGAQAPAGQTPPSWLTSRSLAVTPTRSQKRHRVVDSSGERWEFNLGSEIFQLLLS